MKYRETDVYKFLLKLLKTSHNLQVKAGDFLSQYNLTQVQFNALMILKHEEKKGCSQKVLGDHLSVKGPNISTLIKRLLKLEVITRTPNENDDREKLIKLTNKGLKIITKIEPSYYKKVQTIFSEINHKRLKEAMAILNLIDENSKKAQ
ncbi:MAG: hypothetical protein COA79_12395 [Planctomycetota bacterium]|nr:MAG: hypothetical protein COA79_12395 [Planctomycetota bacterium]